RARIDGLKGHLPEKPRESLRLLLPSVVDRGPEAPLDPLLPIPVGLAVAYEHDVPPRGQGRYPRGGRPGPESQRSGSPLLPRRGPRRPRNLRVSVPISDSSPETNGITFPRMSSEGTPG